MSLRLQSTQIGLDCLALLAGLLLPLAFAPFNLSFMAFLSPALLLFIANKSTVWRGFYRGCVYGIGQFGFGVSWVYISMSTYGGFGAPLAFLITVLLIFILAVFPGCQIYFLNRFRGSAASQLLSFPASWVILEYIRTVFASGFPWLLLGYTQLNTVLRNLAPLIGIYGLSFVTCFSSAVLLLVLDRLGNWAGLLQGREDKKRAPSLSVLLLSVAIIWGTAILLSPIQWTQKGQALQVTLIQGNVPQQLKWEPKQLQSILKIYKQMTEEHWTSSLIIWPEAAIPRLANEVQDYLHSLSSQARKHQVGLLIGAPVLFEDGHFYNAIISAGTAEGLYLKHHLVPFGEYLPLQSWLQGMFHWLHIPMSDFSSGPPTKDQSYFTVKQIPIAAFICYEIAYPTQVLEAAANAQLLVVVTDDSWFGDSLASKQHLQIAQMRALETGKYLLFSTNTGISAIIQPNGQLLATLPEFTQDALTGKIYAMLGKTPLTRIGNHIIVIFCLGLLVFIVMLGL